MNLSNLSCVMIACIAGCSVASEDTLESNVNAQAIDIVAEEFVPRLLILTGSTTCPFFSNQCRSLQQGALTKQHEKTLYLSLFYQRWSDIEGAKQPEPEIRSTDLASATTVKTSDYPSSIEYKLYFACEQARQLFPPTVSVFCDDPDKPRTTDFHALPGSNDQLEAAQLTISMTASDADTMTITTVLSTQHLYYEPEDRITGAFELRSTTTVKSPKARGSDALGLYLNKAEQGLKSLNHLNCDFYQLDTPTHFVCLL
ncbi:MAG: hypothetical protein IPJ88_03230 [Myxococcales bacterium]|nr:MAG: hypothetical protein IPJ88_03230 [Myxococcales bacterium]